MTLTLHTENNMAGGIHDLYLFGEDFEAILVILEDDGELEEQFESSVSDVSTKLENFCLCFGWSTVKSRAHVPTCIVTMVPTTTSMLCLQGKFNSYLTRAGTQGNVPVMKINKKTYASICPCIVVKLRSKLQRRL